MSDSNVSFVRTEPIPPSPPPITETGVVKWARENLFSNIPYTILTLVSLYAVSIVLSGVIPWFYNGTWDAANIRECREILADTGGACFAVISQRWQQILFGFSYPVELYWRPTLAFFLLALALPPVLFAKYLPRKYLIATGLYPFLAYWLIWGGSILSPFLVLVGFVAGYYAYTALAKSSFAVSALSAVVAAIVVWVIGGFVTDAAGDFLAIEAVASRDMGGFMLNMILGIVCVSLSLPFGILLALGRQSDMPIIKGICVVFIEFIRGVPLITLLFVANVVLAYFLPPGSNFDLILRVIIMITMFSSAYIAEVIRGGLAALPKGQYEAADSLGLDYAQAMQLIILPQALKISIPGIVNVAVGLFKDTTLVSIISMFDLIGMIRGPILSSTDWNGIYWEAFGFAALLFFVVCYSISQYSQWLEGELRTDHR